MALSKAEHKEVENIIRKEIRQFMQNNTLKQFENKLLDKVQKEIHKGKLEGEIKNITTKIFKEFYEFMWTNRSALESKLKNIK